MSHDYSKWRIEKRHGVWWVKPPLGSFWGRLTDHTTGEEARLDYIDQTTRRAA